MASGSTTSISTRGSGGRWNSSAPTNKASSHPGPSQLTTPQADPSLGRPSRPDAAQQRVHDLLSRTTGSRRCLSAQQAFADRFYQFQDSGRMEWDVLPFMLNVDREVGRARNVGVMLLPSACSAQYGRCLRSRVVNVSVDGAGGVRVDSELPDPSFALPGGMVLDVDAVAPGGANVSWDFGDGAG
jgi:hypothetical protein